jgi:adapter protein MecA 1/2
LALAIDGGKIYHMDDRYYMMLEDVDLNHNNKEHVIAIMSEFSSPSIITSTRLGEYGIIIMESDAVRRIVDTFY